MSTSTEKESWLSSPTASSMVDLSLYLRVFRRLLRKLNSKHPAGPGIETNIHPPTGHDRLNYLRLLDVRPPLYSCDAADCFDASPNG